MGAVKNVKSLVTFDWRQISFIEFPSPQIKKVRVSDINVIMNKDVAFVQSECQILKGSNNGLLGFIDGYHKFELASKHCVV